MCEKNPDNPLNLDSAQLQELENLIAGLKKGIISFGSPRERRRADRANFPGRREGIGEEEHSYIEKIPA